MSGRVGAEQTPDIEAALTKAFHRDATFGHGAVDTSAECGACRDIMRALAPVLAAAVREARAAELREARDDLYAGYGPDFVQDSDIVYGEWLGNRADRIDVDAPEGGEGR